MVNKQKLRSYYLLTNPLTTIIPITSFIMGILVASQGHPSLLNIVYGSISLFILFISGCILDDIGDKDIDKEFHPDHPLVTDDEKARLSEISVWALSFILDFIGLALAFVMVSSSFFLIMLLYPVIAFLYSIKPRITDWSILGNATFIGFSVSLPFLAGAIVTTTITFQLIIVSIVLLFLGTALDLSKDFVKYYEDRKTKRTSILELLGVERGSRFIAISLFLPYVLSPVMFVLLNPNILYLLFTFGSCFLLMVLSGEMITTRPPDSKESATTMRRKTKLITLIAYGLLEMFLIVMALSIL